MSRRNLKYSSRFLMLAFLLLRSVAGFAASYTSVSSGDWSNSAIWSPAGVPVSGDEVNINSGHTVTYNGDLSWTGGIITINGGGKLIVQGVFTISGGSFNFYDNSDLQVSGNFSYQRWDLGVPSDGSLTVGGNLSVTNGSLTVNEAGELSVTGTVSTSANLTNGGIISIGQSANISGALNNQSQKQIQIGGALSVGNTFANGGSMTVGGNLSVTSSLNVNSSAQLTVTGIVSVSASFDNNGTISIGQSTTIGGALSNNNPSFLHIGGNLTVTNTFNNNATADIDGSLTLTSGDLNVNYPSLVVVNGNLTKSNNISVNGTLVVGGDFISNGGGTTINNGGYYYVFGSLNESGSQANCTSNLASCFPNDACTTCKILSGNQWIDNSSPGDPYISYTPSWWENHLSNVGESDGPTTVCPGSSSSFKVAAVTADAGDLSSNTLEWAVYGGTISGFNGTSVASNSATVDGHTASYQSVHGINGTADYTLSVQWESATFSGAYVAVRQTSANGCSDGKWSVFRINLQGADAPTGNATQTFCAGATVVGLTATGTAIKWYSSSTGGTALATSAVLTNGTYYASQTVDGCESQTRLAVTVTVADVPTTASAGPDQTGASTCGSTTVTLAANTPTVGTGAWSIIQGSGGSFADTSNPATTFTGTAGSTYTLRWTISNSPCSASTDDVVITFNENPTVAVNSPSVCSGGAAATITATPTPSGTYTYVWTVPAGVSNPGNVSSFEATVAGTYSVTITNAAVCTATGSGTLVVNTLPSPTLESPVTSTCPNASGVVYTTQAGYSAYSWSVTGGTIASGQGTRSITVNWGTSTTGQVSVVVTNANGCAGSVSQAVTVGDNVAPVLHDIPTGTLTFAPDGGLCSAVINTTTWGQSPAVSATDNCDPSPVISFTRSDGQSGTTFPIGQTTVTLKVTDASGNVYTAPSFTVLVRETTPPTLTCPAGQTIFCAANIPAAYADLTAFTAAGGIASDNASSGCGINNSSFALLSEVANGSTITRTYQIADYSGNTATCTQTFTISQPTVTISSTGLDNTCPGGKLTINSALDGYTGTIHYQWQVSADGGSNWTNTGADNASLVDATLAYLGDQYRVLVSQTTDFSGTDCRKVSNVLTFVDVTKPVFTGYAPDSRSVCAASGATTASVTNIRLDNEDVTDNCTAFANLNISYTITKDGVVTETGTNLTEGASFGLGTWTVVYTVKDQSNNSETHTFTITVNEEPALNDITTDGNSSTDGSGYRPYQGTNHNYSVTSESGYTFTWKVEKETSPGTYTSVSPTLTGQGTATAAITWGTVTMPGNYRVTVTKKNNTTSCEVSKTLDVTVLNVFNPKVPDQGNGCHEVSMATTIVWLVETVHGSVVAPGWSFDWNIYLVTGSAGSETETLQTSGSETVTTADTDSKEINFTVPVDDGGQKKFRFRISNVHDSLGNPETETGDDTDDVIIYAKPTIGF